MPKEGGLWITTIDTVHDTTISKNNYGMSQINELHPGTFCKPLKSFATSSLVLQWLQPQKHSDKIGHLENHVPLDCRNIHFGEYLVQVPLLTSFITKRNNNLVWIVWNNCDDWGQLCCSRAFAVCAGNGGWLCRASVRIIVPARRTRWSQDASPSPFPTDTESEVKRSRYPGVSLLQHCKRFVPLEFHSAPTMHIYIYGIRLDPPFSEFDSICSVFIFF